MTDYKIHFDKENGTYWIGKVVRYEDGQPMFVQQVGKNYIYKKNAQRYLASIIIK